MLAKQRPMVVDDDVVSELVVEKSFYNETGCYAQLGTHSYLNPVITDKYWASANVENHYIVY